MLEQSDDSGQETRQSEAICRDQCKSNALNKDQGPGCIYNGLGYKSVDKQASDTQRKKDSCSSDTWQIGRIFSNKKLILIRNYFF